MSTIEIGTKIDVWNRSSWSRAWTVTEVNPNGKAFTSKKGSKTKILLVADAHINWKRRHEK